MRSVVCDRFELHENGNIIAFYPAWGFSERCTGETWPEMLADAKNKLERHGRQHPADIAPALAGIERALEDDKQPELFA